MTKVVSAEVQVNGSGYVVNLVKLNMEREAK